MAALPARAQERVLVLERPGHSQAGLVQALRIQLSGLAEVAATPTAGIASAVDAEPGDVAAEPTLDARIRSAGALADARSALLVVWVEGDAEAGRVVAYVVGRRAGRALVEVVEVPGGRRADVDRSVALKVRDVADAVLRARSAPAGEPALLDPPRPAAPPASPTLGALLEAVVVGAPLSGTAAGQWGLAAGAGVTLSWSPYAVEVQARLRWLPAVSFAEAGQELSLSELAPGLWVAGRFHHHDAFGVGLGLGTLLRRVQADGHTAAGSSGERSALSVSLLFAAEARLRLLPPAWLTFRLGLEASPHRQRFAVNDASLADLGHLRPLAELGLAVSL